MNRNMLLLLAICTLVLLLLPAGCKERDEEGHPGSRQQAVEAARAEDRARQAEVRAETLARQLSDEPQAQREREDARSADGSAAWPIAFSAVAAAVQLTMLLLREWRSRRALSRILRWLTGKERP